MENYSVLISDMVKNLNNLGSSLNNEWQAEEMLYIKNAIDSISREVLSLASNIDSIVSDIAYTTDEIRREDEARVVAAREAAARVVATQIAAMQRRIK